MDKAFTVMVIIESKEGKEEELKTALMKIAKHSRLEESCLEYRLHQDVNSPTQFGLYEKWKSKELHQEQFKKSYIIEFAEMAESLLAKPYQAIFAEEVTA